MTMIDYLLHPAAWAAWLFIPFLVEILPAIYNFFFLFKIYLTSQSALSFYHYPHITIIIPVYRSKNTLKACIDSVCASNYPKDKIQLLLIDNMGEKECFSIFCECQKRNPHLRVNWIRAKQGKSKALNMALYNSIGKYIINIDSDGILHPDALAAMVKKLEQNLQFDCLTGTILTNPEAIKSTDKCYLKLLRNMEFLEYCQAFLATRNYESECNRIYTLSGAFSAFRRCAILKSGLYHTGTVCEDTHVTFQLRKRLHSRIGLCTDAFFFVEPISGFNELYTQRQRWQKGELEVAHMFLKQNVKKGYGFFHEFAMRLLLFDHTLSFPRMIWYYVLFFVLSTFYSLKITVTFVVFLYALYVFSAFLYYLNTCLFLQKDPTLHKYYRLKWYFVFLAPLYHFIIYWFRFAGIIHSATQKRSWRTDDFTKERQQLINILRIDINKILQIIKRSNYAK